MQPKIQSAFESVLLADVVAAMGCTEPIAIALAAAKASSLLGQTPQRLTLRCSGNVIKNARCVQVPNSQNRAGIEIAGAIGALFADSEAQLECLQNVTSEQADAAADWVAEGKVHVLLAEGIPGLYVQATVSAGGHQVAVEISGAHTHISEIREDGKLILSNPWIVAEKVAEPEGLFTLENILTFAKEANLDDHPKLVQLLESQIQANEAIAREGLHGQWGAEVGKTLLETRPNDVYVRARALAAGGSDARMSGCALPVYINSGSGNQGLTVSMPVLVYAREMQASTEQLYRALLVSNLVAIHQKRLIGRLSAFCGAVSAAAGAGAGIGLLQGLDDQQIGAVIVNTLATSGGIVCDGAKRSCAAKISVAVENSLTSLDMARKGRTFPAGQGLVGSCVETTIRNVAKMAHDGMDKTDVEILNVMLEQSNI